MDIRTVTVELLRAGPRHNQLISPTTQYLGVCGNAPAGRVTLPYEHGELERLLQELRRRVFDVDDPLRAAKVLDRLGRDVAQVLASIPGVAGSLNAEDERPQTLTHLRIVLSASELAMLPFEASKLPQGEGAEAMWLALKVRNPVCITRHIRSVSSAGLRWPTAPRVLFVAGPDTPAQAHVEALRNVLQPWRDEADSVEAHLSVLHDPTVERITRTVQAAVELRRPFTHVHVLAHGVAFDASDRYSPVGLQLHGDQVLSGHRLATSLTVMSSDAIWRPAVVTVAACNSDKIADVRSTHASVAHELHDQGIALVVASQFPLSKEGSVPFVEHFYQGQLWGDHPLVSLFQVRQHLHSRLNAETHDWASLVAYEAFPADLDDQLEAVRYWQARRAHDAALQRLERRFEADPVPPGTPDATAQPTVLQAVDAMAGRLPTAGPFALECAGLRASGHKRVALAALERASKLAAGDADRAALLCLTQDRLQRSRSTYWDATRTFLASWSEPGRRKANLHWLLGQVLSLDVAMGTPPDAAQIAIARLAAETDLEGPALADRAWAHVSLAELTLFELDDSHRSDEERRRIAQTCLGHARRVLPLLGPGSEQAFTTSRQFGRYVDIWGNRTLDALLSELGVSPRPHWHADNGLVPTAAQVASILSRPSAPKDAR